MSEERRTREPGCLFCRIVDGEIPSTRVAEDDLLLAIRDVAPRAPTHVLILSKDHIASARELGPGQGELLGRLFALGASVARDEGIAERGYRLVTNVGEWGGQSVPHLHFHLLGGREMGWPPG